MCAARQGGSGEIQRDASMWTNEQIWYFDAILWAKGCTGSPLFALNKTNKMWRSEVGEQLEHYGEGRKQRRGTLCRLRRRRRSAHWADDGGKALCEATEDGGATAEQVSIHLLSPNLHPSIHAALRYPCSWPGGYWLPVPGYRPVFEYFFWLKSSNSQDKSATFPRYYLVIG